MKNWLPLLAIGALLASSIYGHYETETLAGQIRPIVETCVILALAAYYAWRIYQRLRTPNSNRRQNRRDSTNGIVDQGSL